MGLIDKLKNVFFEEVEDDEEEELPQTFAKKVEIPKRKNNFLRNNEEEEKPKEKVKEKNLDKLFEENEEEEIPYEEEKQEDSKEEDTFIEVEEEPKIDNKVVPMMFDEDDFQEDGTVYNEPMPTYRREDRNTEKELYNTKKEESYTESIHERPSYSYTKTSYYEEKETKGFKPSPIISPIYGILDKNYRKEEVITKRETRISTSYHKPDLDSVRNKAFASVDEEKKVTKPKNLDTKKYSNLEDEDMKVYDVNNGKPHVDKVTLADAEEYYNDLGLAYNVDYSDASRVNATRSSKYNHKEKKKEKKDVDDNLFDLIDSMYNKED